ncbi:unnamed protein product [Ectocarpus sp. 12 AP-2014]
MMRVGGTRGTMQQCIAEIEDSALPQDFKLKQVRSLVRYMREVDGLVRGINSESGFEADCTAYLEILCTKEESELNRRVSCTRVLKQDFDEKRREWRRTKKNVINAISEMSARALKFECSEKKTIALHAIQFYKNVMANDNGAIPGESESTDGLIDQYRRHRDEISKIPFYADSIMKMLKDIRRTVNASAKLQPGSNAFTQFLDEWWASVVEFLEQSPIVDAERNAREVMQTLKKLKGKQEEFKKREMSRLMNKLEAQDKATPPMTPASKAVVILDDSVNPEDTVRWNEKARPDDEEGSVLEGDTEHDYDGHDEAVDELSELGHGGVDDMSQWSESSPSRSEASLTPRRQLAERGRERGFTTSMATIPDNAGNMSVASWDVGSEPTLGTDGGTDQDIAAASGLPEDESDDNDDEEDDEFEVADSLDLGAVALCAIETGADGQQTYQDTARTPQAMRHLTNKLGVEQQRFSAALDYFRQEQRTKGRRPVMPPPPPSASRSKTLASRGRDTPRIGNIRGRRVSQGGNGKNQRPGLRDVTFKQTSTTSSAVYRSHSLYVSSTSSTSSTRVQGAASARKRTNTIIRSNSKNLDIDHQS